MAEAAKSVITGVLIEEIYDGVLTLRLNRPDRLNALNIELGSTLVNALRRASDDSSVRAIVLTGAGRAFCSGGDLALLRDARMRNAGHELESLVRAGKEIALLIASMPKPVLGCINGPAAGGGANLALCCDSRIASDTATFGESFAKVGLYPDFGGTYHLPRLVGPALAAELFYLGEMITPERAHRIGIYNRVVAFDRLADETRTLAAYLAAGPPIVSRFVKHRLYGCDRTALEAALDQEIERQIQCFASEDCAEGLAAFFEKRPPRFRGK